MSFLDQYRGFGLEDCEADDDIAYSFSSANDSVLEDCYMDEPKEEESSMKSQTTIRKLKKASRASLSSYEASLSAPRRTSGDSTISSTASPSTSLAFTPSLATHGEDLNQKSKTKKSVRFSRQDEWFRVLPLKDYSDRERRKCWYTRSDIIKRDASLDLIAVRIEEQKEPKEDETYRGLEELYIEHRIKTERRRLAVVQAVLDAQEEHSTDDKRVGPHGVLDPVYLAVPSIELTVDSKTEALERGMADMLEVMPFKFDSKDTRSSLPAVQKKRGSIIDPFCVPDRPRRYSAPASSFQKDDYFQKQLEALAILDEFEDSKPPAPPVPSLALTTEADKQKRRSGSPSRRHSLDSSSKHNKSKSRSKSSTTASSEKTKRDDISNSNASPRSPAKKKVKSSISSHIQASPKQRDSSKSRSSSTKTSSSSKDQNTSPNVSDSSPASQVASPSTSLKKQGFKRLIPTTMRSSRSSMMSSKKKKESSHSNAKSPDASQMIRKRIHAPTPPLRQDPPGMFTRISSIRMEEQYPPSIPRL